MFVRNLSSIYHFSNHSTTQLFSEFMTVRTCFSIRVCKAFSAIIKRREENRLNAQIRIVLEYIMCSVGRVVLTYPCMIPTDNKMSAAKVLTHYCMMDGLPWSCVSHFCVKSCKQYLFLRIIVSDQKIIRPYNHFICKVSCLLLSDQGINEQSVIDIECSLLHHLMGNMGNVPCLKSNDGIQFSAYNFFSCLQGTHPKLSYSQSVLNRENFSFTAYKNI